MARNVIIHDIYIYILDIDKKMLRQTYRSERHAQKIKAKAP